MRRLLLGLAASAAVAVTGTSASAQDHRRNVVGTSGNGVGNTVVATNRGPGWGGHHGGPVGFPGGPGFSPGGFFPGGGHQVNRVIDSGNGVNNTVIARTGGGFPFGPGGSGVNINVITNSGNGVGNTVVAGNRPLGSHGVNVNVITNSGNGAGNRVVAGNR